MPIPTVPVPFMVPASGASKETNAAVCAASGATQHDTAIASQTSFQDFDEPLLLGDEGRMANSLTGVALGVSRCVEHRKRTPNWAGRQCAGFCMPGPTGSCGSGQVKTQQLPFEGDGGRFLSGK